MHEHGLCLTREHEVVAAGSGPSPCPASERAVNSRRKIAVAFGLGGVARWLPLGPGI
jgi:hypothetical protein